MYFSKHSCQEDYAGGAREHPSSIQFVTLPASAALAKSGPAGNDPIAVIYLPSRAIVYPTSQGKRSGTCAVELPTGLTVVWCRVATFKLRVGMRTEEVLIWGGVGSLTVVLVLLVSLSFRDRQRLRAEIQQRLLETSDTSERE